MSNFYYRFRNQIWFLLGNLFQAAMVIVFKVFS